MESGPWPVTTFVLVPGACHGGWWYQPLVTELQRAEALIPDLDLGWARPRRFGRGWVLAEFGDDPHRYADAKARKNYASTAPITRASGKSRVVLARYARNRRLADALYLWSFSALNGSPGARALYDTSEAEEPPTTRRYAP